MLPEISSILVNLELILENYDKSKKECCNLLNNRENETHETIGAVYKLNEAEMEIVNTHSEICDAIIHSYNEFKEKFLACRPPQKYFMIKFISAILLWIIFLFVFLPLAFLNGVSDVKMIIMAGMLAIFGVLLFVIATIDLKESFVIKQIVLKYEGFVGSLRKVNVQSIEDTEEVISILKI